MIGLSRTSTALEQQRSSPKGHHGPTAIEHLPAMSSLLACSAAGPMKPEHQELINGRRLCEDRRGAFDHLGPSQFVKGIVRVSMQQGATIMSNYMSDQLKEDMARDEKVQKGEMTQMEADEESAEWSNREWSKRWEVLPGKLITAYTKYHAVTLIMRFYEYIASRRYSLETLDKLTLDPFSAAKRRDKRGEGATVADMTRETWHANLIAYLADYSLHQIILVVGYAAYIRNHRQQQQKKLEQEKQSTLDVSDEIVESDNSNTDLHLGSLVLSFCKKSTLLGISRLVCLTFASLGGGIGNLIMPGWGYLFGFNMGDGCGATVLEEFDLNVTPLQ